ncbi:hypothetical protein IV203_010575 [Nitzschia inconspicua]|uniref:Peptidase M41 domain-containing protein n=1 Tax=Nitzschia inconspicua TaxID=303405 RepID=A0A9K3KWF2_9STRA|nr:hypothetical protein IV203_010575 [Nitzschia inconspicua]
MRTQPHCRISARARKFAVVVNVVAILSPAWSFVCQRSLPARTPNRGVSFYRPILFSSVKDATETDEATFDELLADNFERSIQFLESHPTLNMTRDRFQRIFDAIEDRTRAAEEHASNTRMEQEVPMLSKSRVEMTQMYQALKDQGHLRLFGSINRDNMPASGSHTVRPSLLEEITLLSMRSLTPKPSNTLLYAGVAVATVEAILSITQGWDINLLFFASLIAALGDRILLNGAISETVAKTLSPETQPKITRHEAGHFLCAYLLGCPVEGYVLSAWAALQDPRFGNRGVSAGTSFFDQDLSNQIAKAEIKKSSIDRYSVIVMAGIAAEALNYGQADGGAGDELALISFLSNLNPSSKNPTWNDLAIRNQARYAVLNAILMLREYQECYDALVDALERGGTLGECIHAIENAGRTYKKEPLRKPLGYILEQPGETEEVWVTSLPTEGQKEESSDNEPDAIVDPEESLENLRSLATKRIKDLDDKLKEINS